MENEKWLSFPSFIKQQSCSMSCFSSFGLTALQLIVLIAWHRNVSAETIIVQPLTIILFEHLFADICILIAKQGIAFKSL